MANKTISGDFAVAGGPSFRASIQDYVDLTKPRITWLILISTAIGYYFGHQGPFFYWVSIAAFLHTMIGTGFVVSGTAALNQWYEHDADLKMRRTQISSIPSGRIRPFPALCFGAGLAIVGALELSLGVNWLTSGLSVLTLGAVFLYSTVRVHGNRTLLQAGRVLLASVICLSVPFGLMLLPSRL